jgi:hypothetical protein
LVSLSVPGSSIVEHDARTKIEFERDLPYATLDFNPTAYPSDEAMDF